MFQATVAARGVPSAWDGVIAHAAGGDPVVIALTKAVIAHESEWNPSAVNAGDPSYGLMQVLYGSRGAYPSYTTQQLLDPVTNITLGVRYLREQLVRYDGDLASAVSAYNGGHALVQGDGFANQDYVDDVLAYFNWYRANDPQSADPSGADPSAATDGGDTTATPTTGTDAAVGVAAAIAIPLALLLYRLVTGPRG
jgi:soluble lytic murein transglycosylase-like protein